ncbi:hypothetical protein FB468_1340 [Leucobacter komagatae]|uniref:Uncharacterized protein n=1 Tax=Leucobacter komagatae TaxID=55969 RepID=A0A542Y5F8_9MICO|nr:hypothetical protein [Leucobacter komagatae]TQL43320.1 hypothetical protein FB468_1340 [Leucobacter komagatae]
MAGSDRTARFALVAREAAEAGPSPRPVARSEAEVELAARVRQLRVGALGTGFQTTPSPELSERYAETRSASDALASVLEVTAPPFEAFFALGANEPTANRARADELVPVIAPHGLGAPAWLRVAAADGVLPPIECATEVLRWFAALDRPPRASAVPTVRTSSAHGTVSWTLRWVSAAASPTPERTAPARPSPTLTEQGVALANWPTLPEMFALQARQRSLTAPLVDGRTFTWLAGALPDRALAARHTFDSSTGSIRISTRARSDRGSHVGARTVF